jgi:hypothetical protein
MNVSLDAADAVELGEILAFLSDWLASDPNRLDASLDEFLGAPDIAGPTASLDELRADLNRFACTLLGYNPDTGQLSAPHLTKTSRSGGHSAHG